MAVTTQNGVTTLTPTAWKWFVAAAFTFLILPGFGLVLAVFFVLTGAGVLQRLTLSGDGIKIRNWWSEKSYRWEDIGDFRTRKIKSGLITAANMVSFTHVHKDGTMMGNAAKLLAGGTHSIPAVGMPGKKLAMLMQAYKQGIVPADSAVEAAPSSAPLPAPIPAKAAAARTTSPRPRAMPATRGATRKTPPPPRKSFAAPKKSTPLVQDGGGLFGRRRPDSPFSS